MKCELIKENPCNIYLALLDIDCDHVPVELNNELEWSLIPKEYISLSFRSVSTDRLTTVLHQGIDVEPTNAVIWVNDLSKAIEYGGWPKIVMALDPELLERTFLEVDANISESEMKLIRQDYPTVLKSDDGSKLWCSRLKEDATQIGSGYEIYSARWIQEDPWEALKGIFIFYRPKDLMEVEKLRRHAEI